MDMKMCAASDVAKEWDKIDWNKANAYVKKLQMRIVKAHQEGKHGRVKSLQWLLTHSFYARALAVKRVTENRGKRTAGVDGVLWSTPKAKYEAILDLKRKNYKPQPLKRVYIPKKCTSQQKLDTNFKFFYSKDWFFVQCYGCLDTSLFGWLECIRYGVIVKPACAPLMRLRALQSLHT